MVCDATFNSINQLIAHLKHSHKKQGFDVETHEFDNEGAFKSWKSDVEEETEANVINFA